MRFLLKHEKDRLEFDDSDAGVRVKAWPGLGSIEFIQDSNVYGLEQVVIPIRSVPKLLDLMTTAWVKACQAWGGEPDSALTRRPERTVAEAALRHVEGACEEIEVTDALLDEIERTLSQSESSGL